MRTKDKNALIGGLLAIVFVMAVGYAAFSTNLQIGGTANVTSKWDVHIKSITPGTPVGTATNKGTTIGEDKLSATFKADLVSPGDSITYTVVVENSGTLPAKLSSITENMGSNPAIIHTKNGIAEGDTIAANGGTATFTVTSQYNPDVTQQPESTTSDLTITLNYVQA